MVDGVNEHGEAERVGEEDHFMAEVGGNLADLREEGDGGLPFFGRESDFTGEVVKVGDGALEDVAGAGVAALRIDYVHVLCDVVGCHVLHWGDGFVDGNTAVCCWLGGFGTIGRARCST